MPLECDQNTGHFTPPLRPLALPRYHLPLATWEHGAFAREMPQFLHLADISTSVNKVLSDAASPAPWATLAENAADYA